MAADPDVVAALRQTDLFAGLGDRELRRVADMTSVVHHQAGKAIIAERAGGAGLHLITEGTAEVTVGDASRPDLGPGSTFGEISLIDGKPRSAAVTAATDLTTVFLPRWSFAPLLDEPEVAKALLLVMCERLRRAEQPDRQG